MTTPRYPQGCPAGSQVHREAYVRNRETYAWNVNLDDGNVNWNNRNNNGFALAVRRAGEFQGAEIASFRSLYHAFRRARRQKIPSHNQMRFEAHWGDGLLQLQRELLAHAWRPRRSTCFIATRPKAREIHAPDFADRVVHHWLVPHLERLYDRAFIDDSFANRIGMGSHAAVRRLQEFVRQVDSGQGGGWFLQLDVRNFFVSIHRPTLWSMIKQRMQAARLDPVIQHATHALLRNDPLGAGVDVRASAEEIAQIPAHKRLVNAARGCGLPIGNLSSQFFANVLLDALDQFVKHKLRAKRYLRYVDDFVLIHRDRDQLEAWRVAIVDFLRNSLRLELKAEQRLQPLNEGIDFLGYIVRPTHTLVRRRVVAHLMQALAAWETLHVRDGRIDATKNQRAQIRAVLASYFGHFDHAATHRLRASIRSRFLWIREITDPRKS